MSSYLKWQQPGIRSQRLNLARQHCKSLHAFIHLPTSMKFSTTIALHNGLAPVQIYPNSLRSLQVERSRHLMHFSLERQRRQSISLEQSIMPNTTTHQGSVSLQISHLLQIFQLTTSERKSQSLISMPITVMAPRISRPTTRTFSHTQFTRKEFSLGQEMKVIQHRTSSTYRWSVTTPEGASVKVMLHFEQRLIASQSSPPNSKQISFLSHVALTVTVKIHSQHFNTQSKGLEAPENSFEGTSLIHQS